MSVHNLFIKINCEMKNFTIKDTKTIWIDVTYYPEYNFACT